MPAKKILILDKKQIQQKIDRIAYQLYEDCFEEKEVVIAGIVSRGYTLAKRLCKELEKISHLKTTLLKIELDKDSTSLNANTDIDPAHCANKTVILVDDVLNSGRTLSYGLGVFLDIPLKKIRTVVLVDRNHKKFPVSTDFTGLSLATVIHDHVSVILDEKGEADAVYLQ